MSSRVIVIAEANTYWENDYVQTDNEEVENGQARVTDNEDDVREVTDQITGMRRRLWDRI